MGVKANIHTSEDPRQRAEAERIAFEHSLAIAKVIQAGAYLDEVGRQYWLNNFGEATRAWNKSFLLYKQAKEELQLITRSYITLQPEHEKSPRVAIARMQGLDRVGGDVKAIYSQTLISLQKVIAWLDHIIQLESVGPPALENHDIKPIYSAASEPARELELAACKDLMLLIDASRLTHNMADVIGAVRAVEREGELQAEASTPLSQ
jgi:hypothetical protein